MLELAPLAVRVVVSEVVHGFSIMPDPYTWLPTVLTVTGNWAALSTYK